MSELGHSSDRSGSVEDLLQLVGFTLGKEEFGVDILSVQEINRVTEITKIPSTPDFVKGVINLRGNVIPVIDLRSRLGMPEKEHDKQTRIIVADVEDRTVGLIVDAVSEVIRMDANLVEPPPEIIVGSGDKGKYIKGVGKLDDKLLMLLDINSMFSKQEQKQLSKLDN